MRCFSFADEMELICSWDASHLQLVTFYVWIGWFSCLCGAPGKRLKWCFSRCLEEHWRRESLCSCYGRWELHCRITKLAAPNTYMESTPFSLPNTDAQSSVSNAIQRFFPSDGSRAKVFMPDSPRTITSARVWLQGRPALYAWEPRWLTEKITDSKKNEMSTKWLFVQFFGNVWQPVFTKKWENERFFWKKMCFFFAIAK